MPTELSIQTQILNDAKSQFKDAFAIKLANRFLGGIPDLLIKVPGHEALFVEVKKGEFKAGKVKVTTTMLQRRTMAAMLAAGLRVEVWVVIPSGNSLAMLRVPPEATSVICELSKLPVRQRGAGWPIETFLNDYVTGGNK